MQFEPGIYKIEDRGVFKKCYYLHVTVSEGKKFYQINASLAQPTSAAHILDHYKLKKSLRRPLQIKKVKITLEWTDIDDDNFEMATSDIQMLRRLFEEYPELARAFGSRKFKTD
ncbi:hypothetical protein E1176_03225 [Fulvivirga sp. RKSG066]|uniref:hypothetical protein n=1 Tax=Fulvivirga aurantia TaxID=2529383 RepID=UPI0012BB96CD|nr:hypothetical protein [Fulvivirga aurantia]MTI20025.1 hypothetical protein [Fulvivirga aurantia]